jgi:hypothetical protein
MFPLSAFFLLRSLQLTSTHNTHNSPPHTYNIRILSSEAKRSKKCLNKVYPRQQPAYSKKNEPVLKTTTKNCLADRKWEESQKEGSVQDEKSKIKERDDTNIPPSSRSPVKNAAKRRPMYYR